MVEEEMLEDKQLLMDGAEIFVEFVVDRVVSTYNLFVTSKKRNREFTNSPIHEYKVLQNVF